MSRTPEPDSREPTTGLGRPIVWHLIVLVLGAAAPFVLLTAYLALEVIDNEERQATQLVSGYARATANDAARVVGRAKHILEGLASRPGVGALDPDRCDPLIGELARLQPQYANIFTVNAGGYVVCSARGFPPGAQRTVNPATYLNRATASKAFTLGKPAKGVVTGNWVVVAAQPILDDAREVLGVVGISFDLLALSNIVNKAGLTPDAVVAILDPSGIVLTRHPEAAAWAGRDASGSPMGRIALEQRSGTGREKGLLGIERIWGFAPVAGTDWTVLSGIPTDVVLASARHETWLVAGLTVLGVAFAILLGTAIARPIARPIVAIAAAARRMSAGDSVEHLSPSGPAEIASLAGDLNRLLERRVAAERDLGQTEARLRETERTALTGTWGFLANGSVFMSDQTMELLGLPRGTTPAYEAFLGAIHPDDRASTDQRFRSALDSDAVYFDAEYRVVWPDRQVRSLHSISRIFRDEKGRFTEATGTVHDVTERKLAAERLREGRLRLQGIVNSAMDAIITIDSDGRVTLFNPAAERMFEVDAAIMIGRPLDELIPEALRANPESASPGTLYGRRSSGEPFPLEAAISRVVVEGQTFHTAIVRDITDRVRAQQALEQLNVDLETRVKERTAELEAANRELHAFDYSISHDLRAPLNRIRGFGEALVDGCGDRLGPEGLDLMKRIQSAGESMEQLITDMLALSTISRGDVHRSDVDLSTIARNILDSFERAHSARRIELAIAPGCRADADPGLMRIALENLLGNAWKFTSKREVSRIEFGCVSTAGEQRFFVRDNGAGFDPAKAGQLFEPFRRLHSQAEFRGTGIGLATVQRIFRRHGGRIWAESRVGEGATFWFTTAPAEATRTSTEIS